MSMGDHRLLRAVGHEAAIRALVARGGGIQKVAKALGVGNVTMARVKMLTAN